MTTKPLYKTVLNWYGESHTYWRHASTETGAFLYALRAHAEKVGQSLSRVRNYYFFTTKDNYLITKEVKK
jgi:hypothetical protein